jgi:exopolysaccharide production protein ExoZ
VQRNAEVIAPAPERAAHVASVDALRGLLALSVAVYHFASWSQLFGKGTAASSSVAVLGIYSVEGFFVISGFCFFHLYGGQRFDARALARFHIKRFARIAPVYYLALALHLLLRQPVGPLGWMRLLENLTLSFGLFHPNHSMVPGGWSIGIEYVFYLVFPWLAFWLRRRSVLYLATGALIGLAYAYAQPLDPTQSMWEAFNRYVELPNHAFLFLLGGVIADLRRHTRARVPTWLLLAALLAIVAGCAHVQVLFQDHFEVMLGAARVRNLLASFLVALIVAFHELGTGPIQRLLRWLGELSYSVYLLHPLASLAVGGTVSVQHAPGLAFALALLLTLGFAALSRALIEEPAIAWGKRRTRA